MADDSGFEIVAFTSPPCVLTSTRTASRYVNHDSKYATNILYHCNGKVSWHNKTNYTEYHGSFTTSFDGTLDIRFSYRGDETNLKKTVLQRTGPFTWRGFDYLERRIDLRLITQTNYCSTCHAWH